jgi:energy-coupling factor transporter ATP-binding protein EcfA2
MEYVKKDREVWKKELAEQIKSVEDLKKFPNLNLDLAPWNIVVDKILKDTNRESNSVFKEWLLSKEYLGYLFNSVMYLIAYKCYRRLCKNNDVVVVITGREGTGKSTLAMKFCMLVSPTFSLKHICFNRGQFFNGLDQCNKKDSFLLDEGNLIIFGRDYASKGSKNTIKLFSTMRQKNVMTIIAVPSFQTLDTYIRKHRVHFMFRVVRRGGGFVYGEEGVRMISDMLDKNNYSYRVPPGWMQSFYFGKRIPVVNDLLGYDEYAKFKNAEFDLFLKDIILDEKDAEAKVSEKREVKESKTPGKKISLDRACKLLRTNENRIKSWISEGKIKGRQLDETKRWYIDEESVNEFIKSKIDSN